MPHGRSVLRFLDFHHHCPSTRPCMSSKNISVISCLPAAVMAIPRAPVSALAVAVKFMIQGLKCPKGSSCEIIFWQFLLRAVSDPRMEVAAPRCQVSGRRFCSLGELRTQDLNNRTRDLNMLKVSDPRFGLADQRFEVRDASYPQPSRLVSLACYICLQLHSLEPF